MTPLDGDVDGKVPLPRVSGASFRFIYRIGECAVTSSRLYEFGGLKKVARPSFVTANLIRSIIVNMVSPLLSA